MDEYRNLTIGTVTISTGELTLTYDANDLVAIAMDPCSVFTAGVALYGEDNNYGDYSVAFSAGGIGVTYTKDQ